MLHFNVQNKYSRSTAHLFDPSVQLLPLDVSPRPALVDRRAGDHVHQERRGQQIQAGVLSEDDHAGAVDQVVGIEAGAGVAPVRGVVGVEEAGLGGVEAAAVT